MRVRYYRKFDRASAMLPVDLVSLCLWHLNNCNQMCWMKLSWLRCWTEKVFSVLWLRQCDHYYYYYAMRSLEFFSSVFSHWGLLKLHFTTLHMFFSHSFWLFLLFTYIHFMYIILKFSNSANVFSRFLNLYWFTQTASHTHFF